MSDNLEVAKECGAIEAGNVGRRVTVSVEGHIIFTKEELEAYTSRILASQQAAHEAEVARLKEELAEATLQRNVAITSRNACQRTAESAIAERKQLEPLRLQVAMLVKAVNATWSEDFHLHHHYCEQLKDAALKL